MVVVLCLKLLRDEVVMAFHICTYGRSPSHSQGLPEKQPFRPGVCKPSSWTKSALPPVCFLNLAAGIFREELAPHYSTLAWKIPWAEEPGRLLSMGLLRVGHNWGTSLSLFTFMRWRRKWQPTPVFLPGESQERRSLVGFRLWGHTKSDTTEAT